MSITDRDIDQAFSDHKVTCGGVREDYFGLLYLMHEFDLPVDAAKRQIAFFGRDYGFDAYHQDAHDRALYLFQFKWSTSPKLFRESFQRLIDAGIERLFGNTTQDVKQNEFLYRLKQVLVESRELIDTVFLHFVFNGDPDEAERSPVLEHLSEQLYAKRYILEEFFGRPVRMQIQFLRPRVRPPLPPPPASHRIQMTGAVQQPGPNGEVMHLGFIRLLDLDAMFQSLGQKFFSRNIRSFVGEGTAPNRAILQSLRRIVHEQREDPAVFAFNHNGVTIAAQKLTENGDGYLLYEPRLLNGAQTVTTFCRFMSEARTKFGNDGNTARVAELRVPCKVITRASDSFVTTVTINNNRQNPIEPWNLRANDLIQLQLQEKFRDELKMYYERQQNAFANMTDQELEQQGITQGKAIELLRLAKTFLASDGEIDKMSRMNDVFESDSAYAKVFGNQRLGCDARLIVLCYKAQFRLNALIRGRDYPFLRRISP